MTRYRLTAKQLIFKERLNITGLVMAVLMVFVVLVGFLVPLFQRRSLSNNAYRKLDAVVVNAINASYGYGSSDNINPDQNELIFVVISTDDGDIFATMNASLTMDYFIHLYEKKDKVTSRYDEIYKGYYLSIMTPSYISEHLSIDRSAILPTEPIGIPDDLMIYAGIDRTSDIEAVDSSSWILAMVLIVGYLILIPIVYLISNRVMKPTRETIRHEKEFVANASHELKTPLAIITADAEILREKNPDNSQYVNNIISQCANMNETVLDMIDLSKLETSQRPLERVNFSQLLLNLCLSFDAVAYERGISYSYDIEENIFLEEADSKNLTRLVNLLIDNAMKYTENERIITISLKKTKKGPLFKVYNTGCQIHDEDREKVFERFYQGRSGADNERKGSGLGLAIVKQICETYQYAVDITSHYLQDMCFTVLLK
ncbi:sensor histidine kinase [Treponema rectale]|uniref:histidine kinase n=1 Tax=Treponema rectale TaxID=744512 RepID=A0A7M1XI16_9SPIR|nr:sensor histidine kinase [Treponema rectale]